MNIADRFQWLRAVIAADPRPTLAEVAAAAVLAEHYNQRREAAWPAQGTIAELVRMHRRSVRKALDGLEARGFIVRVGAAGPHRAVPWALNMPDVASHSAMPGGGDGAPQRQQGASQSANGGRSTAPHDGAAQRPEQVSRSENVGNRYGGAPPRSAKAARSAAANKPIVL